MDLRRRTSFLLPLSLLGCRADGSPERVGQSFIDKYYIERDPARALGLSSGAAAERVRREQGLLTGSGAQTAAAPKVYSRLERTQDKGEHTELTYGLDIDAGGLKLKKRVLLQVRKVEGGYRVVFFSESDLS